MMKAMPEIKPTPSLRFITHPKPRSATRGIVVHHTAAPPSQSVEDIHAYHQEIGWIGIGYSLVQTADGVWREGRGIDTEGAHAKGYNRDTIGICLTGNFETRPVPDDRWLSLVSMCAALCRRYGLSAADVRGHRELPGAATLCPGKYIDMDRLRREVSERLRRTAPPTWRVSVDGRQIGAFLDPTKAVAEAVSSESARKIEITRI